jgi:hypothetical protein
MPKHESANSKSCRSPISLSLRLQVPSRRRHPASSNPTLPPSHRDVPGSLLVHCAPTGTSHPCPHRDARPFCYPCATPEPDNLQRANDESNVLPQAQPLPSRRWTLPPIDFCAVTTCTMAPQSELQSSNFFCAVTTCTMAPQSELQSSNFGLIENQTKIVVNWRTGFPFGRQNFRIKLTICFG